MNLITLPVVDSTNSHALRLLDQGLAVEGTVVLAWEQTSGRGQRGSSWDSQPGQGLYFSIILTPPSGTLSLVSVLIKSLALGVIRYFNEQTSCEVAIKWPNDILAGERKICGILMESVIKGDQLSGLVVGIGINLNHAGFPDDFNRPAVSLYQLTGQQYNPESEVSKVVRHVMQAYRTFLMKGAQKIEEEYNDILYGKNQLCRFILDGKNVEAVLLGVNDQGEAEIEMQGKRHHFPHPYLRLAQRTG